MPKKKMENLRSSLSSLKTVILVSLCLQNAGYTLLRKYSRQTEHVSSTEILLVSELIKVAVSTRLIVTSTEISDAKGKGYEKLLWLLLNSKKMLILAGIYGAMNILSFVALQYIGAGEFTICAQLKILTTAGFSVMILRTSLSWTKWRALTLLVLGCILVASPNFSTSKPKEDSQLQILGYFAVLTEVCLSGFASIYFEKVVKSTTEVVTIWERNFQLGLYSIMMYTMIVMFEARANSTGWSFVTLLVSVLGAAGGLLVAATLKYADSILKTLAAAGAIVMSTYLGHVFLDGPLNLVVAIGAMATIIAIANYTFDTENMPPPKTVVAQTKETAETV